MHHDMNSNNDSGYLESTVSSLRDQVKQKQHRHKGDGSCHQMQTPQIPFFLAFLSGQVEARKEVEMNSD